MRRESIQWVVSSALVLTSAMLAGTGPAEAEDLKGKFFLGGSLGVLVTTDNVRNNAALIIAPLGDDGAPFTGDRGEVVSCESNLTSVFCDPRPDDLISREAQIEQTFTADVRVGYGLTSALSVELSAGYFKGDLRNIDVYTTKTVPFSQNPLDPCLQRGLSEPCNLRSLREKDFKEPITAAEITEIPIEANAVVRFRKDSNFNPYVGAGIGYLITDVAVDENVSKLNDRFESLRLTRTTDEFGRTFGRTFTADPNGNAEFLHPLKVTIDDGFQWQFIGGVDYFFSDRFSLHFEAKYVLAKKLPWSNEEGTHQVIATFGGEDQVNLTGFPEDMFRADGSVKIFHWKGIAPNPVDPASGKRFDCDHDDSGGPLSDVEDMGQDYDGDGNIDQCWNPAQGVSGDPEQTVVAQGGTIDLTNFTFGFGLKFHF